jgi:hypothetical protein
MSKASITRRFSHRSTSHVSDTLIREDESAVPKATLLRRLLETPEEVSPDEARNFLDWVRAEFQELVRRQR